MLKVGLFFCLAILLAVCSVIAQDDLPCVVSEECLEKGVGYIVNKDGGLEGILCTIISGNDIVIGYSESDNKEWTEKDFRIMGVLLRSTDNFDTLYFRKMGKECKFLRECIQKEAYFCLPACKKVSWWDK
ncbi:hypothetical protein KKF32_01895 [Patescibacteria group bacterium]|nr:hypothetical protein [Patescibacteria group bacterium]